MKKSLLIMVFIFLILTSCVHTDWPKDPNAPSWAVDFGKISSLNMEATLSPIRNRFYWTPEQVVEHLGLGLSATWISDNEFMVVYRTTHPGKYAYTGLVFREDQLGRRVYGYYEAEANKKNLEIRVTVAKAESLLVYILNKKVPDLKNRKGGI